jgi:predicted Zn-dependent protease
MSAWWLSAAVWALLLTGARGEAGAACAEEQARARMTALYIDEEWPRRAGDDDLSRYVQALGERLGRVPPGGKTIPWRFTVLRDHAPFAFAIGHGFVYVTEGAVAFARNESELAAILSHEIGHQVAGHFCREPQGASWPDGNLEQRQAIGSVIQVFDIVKEQQADQRAVGILRESGYDPRAMLDVARRLSGGEHGSGVPDRRRLSALAELFDGVEKKRPARDSAEFRRVKKALAAE